MTAAPSFGVGKFNYRRPLLYPKQEAAIFDPRRTSLIEAGTKTGKTVGCIIWLFEQAIRGLPGDNFWWVAPVYPQAEIAFRRMMRHFVDDDGRSIFLANMSALTLTLPQLGVTIWFKSGEKPDNLFGEDVRAVVIDEASRLREDAWHAVRTVITATRGRVRAIGNVKGRRNWFYQLARRAEQVHHPDMGVHKLIAHDAIQAGVLADEEIEAVSDSNWRIRPRAT
jgi:hypothetical protein